MVVYFGCLCSCHGLSTTTWFPIDRRNHYEIKRNDLSINIFDLLLWELRQCRSYSSVLLTTSLVASLDEKLLDGSSVWEISTSKLYPMCPGNLKGKSSLLMGRSDTPLFLSVLMFRHLLFHSTALSFPDRVLLRFRGSLDNVGSSCYERGFVHSRIRFPHDGKFGSDTRGHSAYSFIENVSN